MLVEEMLWLQNKPEDNGVMKPDSCVVFFQALHSVTLVNVLTSLSNIDQMGVIIDSPRHCFDEYSKLCFLNIPSTV